MGVHKAVRKQLVSAPNRTDDVLLHLLWNCLNTIQCVVQIEYYGREFAVLLDDCHECLRANTSYEPKQVPMQSQVDKPPDERVVMKCTIGRLGSSFTRVAHDQFTNTYICGA